MDNWGRPVKSGFFYDSIQGENYGISPTYLANIEEETEIRTRKQIFV